MGFTRSGYFSTALALTCLAVWSVAPAGQLQVGAARVEITGMGYPGGKVPPLQYENQRIFIRALVLDNGETTLALVGADLGSVIWDAGQEIVPDELGIPIDNVIMTSTHTHSSIPGALRDNDRIGAAVRQVVRNAKSAMQPASMAFGTGAAYLNVNRDTISEETRLWTQAANLDGPSDKTLAVLAFFGADGAPIAAYMNYAMHPVNGYQSGLISADFPGAASRHVEQAFGDQAVVIFTQGAAGDQNPLHLRNGTNQMAARAGVPVTGFEMTRETVEAPLREGRAEPGEGTPESRDTLLSWMEAMGMVVGEEAIRVMSHMDRRSSDVRMSASYRILNCPGRVRTDSGREGYPGTYTAGPDVQIRVGFAGINDVALATVNRDVYSIIGRKVKENSPLRNTMFVGYANGFANTGYIISDDAFGRNTFQALGTRLTPGCAEPGIVSNLTDMIYEHMGM